jgi:predicted dienelactone hydrolase
MFKNLKEFPKPMGNYVVGITDIDFLDEKRKGVFSFAKAELRNIPTRIFYPADSNEGKVNELYIFDEAAKAINKSSLRLISLKSLNIKTHCFYDVKLSSKKKSYPVIFFNHGYLSYSGEGTVLCSDLASKGYVVVSVGHPYESSVVKYKDASILEASNELATEFKNTMNKQMSKKFKAILNTVYDDKEIFTILEDFYQNFKETSVWNNVKIWAEDTRFVADQLYKLNDGSIHSSFKNKLNLELGFGITGHSYGGCTAAQVCLDDARFKCGVNMDAPSYGDYWNKDIRKPFMIIGSNIIENSARTIYLSNSKDSYFFVIDDTKHMDYCDYLYFAHQLKILGAVGNRDMYLLRDIISNYHIDFFDKYILCDETVDLQRYKYDGVKSRMKNIL